MQPCFNNDSIVRFVEDTQRDGEAITTRGIRITRYKSLGVAKGIGILTQPVAQYYFHRPLSALFSAAFRAGLMMDALAEPAFPERSEPSARLTWSDFGEIPPVIIAHMRLLSRRPCDER